GSMEAGQAVVYVGDMGGARAAARVDAIMNRRDFVQRAAAAIAAAGVPRGLRAATPHAPAPPRRADLRVGTQHGDSDDILTAMAAFGVNHICIEPPGTGGSEDWSADALSRKREHVESFGLKADALRLLHPTPLASSRIKAVMMGRSPERDREIDEVCDRIRAASRAGFPTLTYNLSMLGVVRTGTTPGRGGAKYSTFDYDTLTDRDELTEAGQVSAEQSWERIAYFVRRVMPVADEYKVRLACHPRDPAMPEPAGYRGVHRVLSTVDGLKRFVE